MFTCLLQPVCLPKNLLHYQILTLTSLSELALVHTQVFSSTVLLKNLDLIPHVAQVVGEMHCFAKVHHVHTHSALVHRAPQHGWLLGGEKRAG